MKNLISHKTTYYLCINYKKGGHMEKGKRRGEQQIYAKESASVFDFTERISGRIFSIVIRGPT